MNKSSLTKIFKFGFIGFAIAAAAGAFFSYASPNALGSQEINETRLLYDHSLGGHLLGGSSYETLSQIADVQAQIWGDTILEGDYVAEGDTRLDRIEGNYRGDTLISYRITYSERAWYTGECKRAGSPDLASCQEGRITEMSYVSPDLKHWDRDPEHFAEFH